LEELIGNDIGLFSEIFNINSFCRWEHGNYVLIQTLPLPEIAGKHSLTVPGVEARKRTWETMLFDRLEKRAKPRLDDKCLTSWNAIMGKRFADAYKALNNTQDLEAAVQTANFIIGKLWSPDGNLFRNYKNGKATINGYLEDYAHVIDF